MVDSTYKIYQMNAIKQFFLLALLCFPLSIFASGEKITASDYINQWKDEALFQMVEHHIPASITLAQGLLESGNGNSTLARKANNHFGIKCHGWDGKKVYHDDDKRQECFRKYKDPRDSYEDHSKFLQQPRYQFLYNYKVTDYKAWAKGLKKAGYATDPKYPKRLINLIENNNLAQFDKIGVQMMKSGKKPNKKQRNGSKPHKNNRSHNKDIEEDNELPDVLVSNSRKINHSKNRINYVYAKKGDTFESIALDLDLMPWQIWKYNDLTKKSTIKEGQIIYVQPKRNNGSKKWHVLQPGETLWDVSQKYGIKLKKLYKKNGLTKNSVPNSGTKLSLKKNLSK